MLGKLGIVHFSIAKTPGSSGLSMHKNALKSYQEKYLMQFFEVNVKKNILFWKFDKVHGHFKGAYINV